MHLALRQFRPLLLGKHVLVRTDNTAAVSYINRLGGIRSHRMSQLKFLSLKTALLTALTSIKRVGDLQAFSVSEECLVFGPVYSHVVLRPRPGYVPKVPTMPFHDQVVNLQALPSEEADPALALLCPVRTLRIYVDRTRSVRSSEQLFVCHGGQQKGKAVSKQRLAHWIVEAVLLVYQSEGEPCPLGLRAHSTRSVASSHAFWQTSAELRAGRRRTPSQDSTISALSQFLPVCWVSNGREELTGVTLAAPFPLTQGYERLFSSQFSYPDGEPWWNPPSTPGSQTGRNSLTPGPVLVLACPGLQSAPVLGQSISVSPHVTSLRTGCGLHSALPCKARFPAVTASCNNK